MEDDDLVQALVDMVPEPVTTGLRKRLRCAIEEAVAAEREACLLAFQQWRAAFIDEQGDEVEGHYHYEALFNAHEAAIRERGERTEQAE